MTDVSNETTGSSSEEQTEVILEGEHETFQQKQATFLTYRSLSEWIQWAQPIAMNMQRVKMQGITEEVMLVDYISRNG